MPKNISEMTEEEKSFIERYMTSFRIRKCLNSECENAVIGHRCSGFCSIECMDRYLDLNRMNKKEE